MEWTPELAARLREERERRDLTQAEVARMAEVSISTVADLERFDAIRRGGEPVRPRRKTARAVLAAVGLTLEEDRQLRPVTRARPGLTRDEWDEIKATLAEIADKLDDAYPDQ